MIGIVYFTMANVDLLDGFSVPGHREMLSSQGENASPNLRVPRVPSEHFCPKYDLGARKI